MVNNENVNLSYPKEEQKPLAQLHNLFDEWKKEFAADETITKNNLTEYFVTDGFYPYYFSQKVKILFIGRESRGLSSCDNMKVLFNAYKKKSIGDRHINNSRFHCRMIYIAYGINNNFPAWKDIPSAETLVDKFGAANGFSFAFMNLSKLSNEEESYKSNWKHIDASAKASTAKKNLILEEIKILHPDVIVTMNFEDRLDYLGQVDFKKKYGNVLTYNLKAQKDFLVIDTYHFSATNKDDIKDYYEPISIAVRESLKL